MAKLIRDKFGKSGEKIVEFWAGVANADPAVCGTTMPTLADRMKAYDWLAVRGWGKAVDVIEIRTAAEAVDYSSFTDAELDERGKLIDRLHAIENDRAGEAVH